ncbi:MAG: helix-turn-helix transcriptional regulator [Chloroflexota bacterium]
MSDLEPTRREIRADLASNPEPAGRDLDPEFERLLEAAAAELEPTDEWLEAIEALAGPTDLSSAVADAAISHALREARSIEHPDLVALRVASGLSVADAARRLGISSRAMEQIESKRPMGWLQVQASAAAAYLDLLGVRRGQFLRWLAIQFAGPRSEFAYGYRPRESPTAPVPIAAKPALANEFRAWASMVMSEAR